MDLRLAIFAPIKIVRISYCENSFHNVYQYSKYVEWKLFPNILSRWQTYFIAVITPDEMGEFRITSRGILKKQLTRNARSEGLEPPTF